MEQGAERQNAVAELMAMMFELHRLLKAGEIKRAIMLLEYGTEGIKRMSN